MVRYNKSMRRHDRGTSKEPKGEGEKMKQECDNCTLKDTTACGEAKRARGKIHCLTKEHETELCRICKISIRECEISGRSNDYPRCHLPQEAHKKQKPRPIVREFGEEMERQLLENEYKGGWDLCPDRFLMSDLLRNVAILQGLLNLNATTTMVDRKDIIRRAANIANFAMMIAENEGKLNAFGS